MKRLAAVFVLLAAAVPAMADPTVKEVSDSWRTRLAKDLPNGTMRATVAEWAKRNQLTLAEGSDPSHLILPLGYVKEQASGSFTSASIKVCNGWGISAEFTFNGSDELVSRQVRTLGNCL